MCVVTSGDGLGLGLEALLLLSTSLGLELVEETEQLGRLQTTQTSRLVSYQMLDCIDVGEVTLPER